MKQIKIIKIKPSHPHFLLDTDRDSHLDYEDCQPFNPKKHVGAIPAQPTEELYYYEELQKRKKK